MLYGHNLMTRRAMMGDDGQGWAGMARESMCGLWMGAAWGLQPHPLTKHIDRSGSVNVGVSALFDLSIKTPTPPPLTPTRTQRWTAVTAYSSTKQLLLFALAWRYYTNNKARRPPVSLSQLMIHTFLNELCLTFNMFNWCAKTESDV